jgi:hypothetical protein
MWNQHYIRGNPTAIHLPPPPFFSFSPPPPPPFFSDIDKQEFNLVPLDLKTFIDFYVFY